MRTIKRIAWTVLPLCAVALVGMYWQNSAQAVSTHSAQELEQFRQLHNKLIDNIARRDTAATITSIAHFRAFISTYPESVQRRWAYVAMLEAHRLVGGDCTAISGLVDTTLAEYTSHSELYLAALALESSTCRPERSAEYIQRAISTLADTTSPHMPRYLMSLGINLQRQGQRAKAVAAWRRALALDQQRMAKTESSRDSFANELKRRIAEEQATE